MKKLNISNLEVKKSKFIGLLYEVSSKDEVELILNELKNEHKKARHIVYAYRISGQEKNYSDKEPSGTTRGLLDLIHLKNKDNILIIVIRYFGGILLGSGPLTRTYTKVASMLFIK
jgi:putative IMPACT (imprinted ancient) family translation regulator